MRLENIPKQVLIPNGNPTFKFIKGGIVIHSNLRPCLVVDVDRPLTIKQRNEGFVGILLRENRIGAGQTFQPLWENMISQGKDLTTYKEFKTGTKLTVWCQYFIQEYQMTVVEDVKPANKDGYFKVKAQTRQFDRDDPTSEGAYTEILTLSLDGLLANPKIKKTLTCRTGEGKKKKTGKTGYANGGWGPLPNGNTTGSHTTEP